jgi:hypothetical protein
MGFLSESAVGFSLSGTVLPVYLQDLRHSIEKYYKSKIHGTRKWRFLRVLNSDFDLTGPERCSEPRRVGSRFCRSMSIADFCVAWHENFGGKTLTSISPEPEVVTTAAFETHVLLGYEHVLSPLRAPRL